MRTEAVRFGQLNFRAEQVNEKKENVSTSASGSVVQNPAKETKANKVMPLVTAAVAVASLGVSIYAAAKNHKSEPANKAGIEEIETKIKAEIEAKINALMNELNAKSSKDDLTAKFNEIIEKINSLNIPGINNDLSTKYADLISKVNELSSKITSKEGFYSRLVDINGEMIPLATVLNPVSGEHRAAMVNKLQTESTRRLLGLSEGLKELPKDGMIRIPLSEYKGIASTGGMSIVPKEIAENLSKMIAGRQDVQVVVDIPLYRGIVEKSEVKGVYTKRFNKLVANPDNTYNYIQYVEKEEGGVVTPAKPNLLGVLKKIDSMYVDVITDTKVNKELVDIYMGEKKLPLNYEKIKNDFPKELAEEIEKLTVKEGETEAVKEWGTLEIVKNKDGKINAFAKVKTVFYDNGVNGKFDFKVPLDSAKDIYNDKSITSGETERFIYFSKFFYESLLRGKESKVPLKADIIIGNDWQSGPISAMVRQLTTVKKSYGLSPDIADQVYNTPIITIMHNANLNGGAWHSQSKLLNIMFGEHAAEVLENSHMPNLSIAGKADGINSNLFNGMMEGKGVNPQMMAVAYSDYLIPVSESYAKEISTQDVYGGARKKLYEFRARIGAYSNLDNLKLIANQNQVDASLVKNTNPTLIGITNGADKANNTLTPQKAEQVAANLGLEKGAFSAYSEGTDKLLWHNNNKMAGIRKIQQDIEATRDPVRPTNPMCIEDPLNTDLTGVTEKTPVFVSAGRIVDQKGLDILADSIIEFYKDFKGTDYPVFYVQGVGDTKYKDAFMRAKNEVAKTNPNAAKRIVFATLFSEPGRFDCAKMIADWAVCPSWFEPCGLAHKEIGLFSGAGAVVNKTGGLAEGLKDGVNCIISDFVPDRSKLNENGKNFAKAMQKAVDIHSDDNKYREVLETMLNSNFDWAREGGPIYQYTSIFEKMGVINHNVATAKPNL